MRDAFPKGFGGEAVIVIEEGDEFAEGEFQRFLGGEGDAAIVEAGDEADLSGMAAGEVFDDAVEFGVAGAVVDDAKLPAGIELTFDREEAFREMAWICFVDGGEDADKGAVGPGFGLPGAGESVGGSEIGYVFQMPLIVRPGAGVPREGGLIVGFRIVEVWRGWNLLQW